MTRRLFWPGLVTLVSLAILIALGAWQWRRMGEKTALIRTIAAHAARMPAPLPTDWSKIDVEALAYVPVEATGTFDHSRETHVFFSLSTSVPGIAQAGPGYLIITPFKTGDGQTILVNRGFVPVTAKEPATRSAGQREGPQTITGLLRLAEVRGRFSGADDPVKNVFYVRDPAAIAAAKGLGPVAPMLIDLKTPEPAGHLPVPNVTQIAIPNNHFQYALTWWSLAGVLAVIFTLFARTRQN